MLRILFSSILVLLMACAAEPEPIRYGRDNCYACKMTLSDRRFGAEVVSAKGKVFKFDDVNCLAGFLKSGFLPKDQQALVLVVSHAQPEKLIDARKAAFVYSAELRSPMRSDLAAFPSRAEAETVAKQVAGRVLTFEEALSMF